MRSAPLNIQLANVVLDAVSKLQKSRQSATLKSIKNHIAAKHGNGAEKYMRLVPSWLKRGMNLGLIQKHGDNFRTKIYLARRRRGRGGRKGGKRRRRSRSRK